MCFSLDNFSVFRERENLSSQSKRIVHCYRFAILHFSFLKIFYFRITEGLFGKREKMK